MAALNNRQLLLLLLCEGENNEENTEKDSGYERYLQKGNIKENFIA